MQKIFVLTGLYPPEIGGPATHTRMLEEGLPKHGFEVEVLPFSEVRHLPKVIRHIVYFFKCVVRGKSAHIFFAQDPVSVGLPALCAAKILGKRFVIRVPGDYVWEQATQRFGVKDNIDTFQQRKYGFAVEFLRSIQVLVVQHADVVITPSNYFRALVVCWGVQGAKVHTIYNGLTLGVQKQPPAHVPSNNLIVSAGRLVPWKGFDVLIEMLGDMAKDWTLVIIGEGPEKERLEHVARIAGVSDRVIFTGRIAREEVFGWYDSATVFVLNTSFESFSFQVVEAMIAGIPIVTTSIGSLPELISHEEEGLLVVPNDRQGFQRAVESVLEEPKKWRERTQKAREKAKQFSLENMISQLADVLVDCVRK